MTIKSYSNSHDFIYKRFGFLLLNNTDKNVFNHSDDGNFIDCFNIQIISRQPPLNAIFLRTY